ncbi:MAG: secreted protein [Marmoricola sp.]|nr:secreted protein [Marmoricola sp.]
MSDKYVPKHRNAPPRRARAKAKNAVYYSGIAAIATGLTVSGGIAAHGATPNGTLVNLAAGKSPLTAADLARREASVSRSSVDRRTQVDALKAAELATTTGAVVARSVDISRTDPKTLTRALMSQYGLNPADFNCVDEIWTQESNWNVHAANPSSSAYGIPQALPGSKMASAGADWQNSAETQIRWGLSYIANRYGSACAAWSFKQGHGYY